MDPHTAPSLCPQCATPLPAPGAQCPACSATQGDYLEGIGDVADIGCGVVDVGAGVSDLADAGLLSSVADGIGSVGGAALDVIGAIGGGIGSAAGAVLDAVTSFDLDL